MYSECCQFFWPCTHLSTPLPYILSWCIRAWFSISVRCRETSLMDLCFAGSSSWWRTHCDIARDKDILHRRCTCLITLHELARFFASECCTPDSSVFMLLNLARMVGPDHSPCRDWFLHGLGCYIMVFENLLATYLCESDLNWSTRVSWVLALFPRLCTPSAWMSFSSTFCSANFPKEILYDRSI